LGGVVHLPEEFRQVARLANAAGLRGLEVTKVDYGLDVEKSIAAEALRARVKLTYRPAPAAGAMAERVENAIQLFHMEHGCGGIAVGTIQDLHCAECGKPVEIQVVEKI